MNSLYKRFVTMAMISFSAILAWVYCLLELRSTPIYIAAISLVVVGSIYALLFAAYGIKAAKDKKLEELITHTVNKLVEEINQKDNLELERIAKASYVQLRKSNTMLSKLNDTELLSQEQQAQLFEQLSQSNKEFVSQSVNKALKLAIKYNQSNNDKLIETVLQMSADMSKAYKELATSVSKLNLELIDLKSDVSRIQVSDPTPGRGSLDMFDSMEDTDVTVPTASADSFFEEFGEAPASDLSTESIQDTVSEDSTSDFDEDIAGIKDIPVASTVESEPEEYHVPDNNGLLDQSLIDALLNNLDNSSASAEVLSAPEATTSTEANTADIIPFPAAEAPTNEPAVQEEAPSEVDPNKPLSPDEIAALFASMGSGDAAPAEPEPEPAPAPVDSDPNRQLSPDEIAALFASMQ